MRPATLYVGTDDGLRVLKDLGGKYQTAAHFLRGQRVTDVQRIGMSLFATTDTGCLARVFDEHAEVRYEFARRLWFVSRISTGRIFVGGTPSFLAFSDDGLYWNHIEDAASIAEKSGWRSHSGGGAHLNSMADGSAWGGPLVVASEAGGVLQSNDLGESWFDVTNNLNPDVHRIYLNPIAPGPIVAATGEGVFFRDLSCSTWQRLAKLNLNYCQGLVSPSGSDEIFVSCSSTPFGRRKTGEYVGTNPLNRFGLFRIDRKSSDFIEISTPSLRTGGVLSKALIALEGDARVVLAGSLNGAITRIDRDGDIYEMAVGIDGIIECLYVTELV